jgi:hypothetical protein
MTMVINVNGTNGATGQKGGDATYTYNGHIGADSMTVTATGGNGGTGANGGNASITLNGNIFQPMGPSLDVITTAIGGTGGSPGNGGNASVAINGNIIQTSKLLSEITLDAVAEAGVGTKAGNATATVNGNIVQYNNATATNVTLDAAAFLNPDSPANHGNSAFGSKTASVNGNIIQGNVNNLLLAADAYSSNATASVSGNIFTAKPTNTGTVTLEATGQNIAITGNILNLGKQDLDITLDELGPAYGAKVSGNIFNGTGSNNLVLNNSFNPGPSPGTDTASVNLATGTLTFNGGTNIINKFGGLALTGDIAGNFIGTTGNNNLNAGMDTTSGTIIFQGNGGTDTLTGGPTALNVAYFAGSEWQYAITGTLPGDNVHPVTVVGGPMGQTSNDTLTGIQRLKFLAPANVSDVNDDGFGDLVFQDGAGNFQVNILGTTPSTVTLAQTGWNAVGTGQFTADTDRNSSILLQTASGELGVQYAIAGTPSFTGPILGGGAGVTASTFTGWTAITAGDFNGDAASDVLLQQGPGGAVEIAFMNTKSGEAPGTIDQISAVTSPSGGNWNAISSSDFNGDGNSDILWQNSVTGALDISLMNGAAGTPASIGTLPAGYTAIGSGDFNGDGKSDVLLENTTTGGAQIWLMNGTSEVGSPINVNSPGTVAAGWKLLGAEDINKDGISDILWQNSLTGDVQAQAMTTGGATLGTLQDLGMPASNSFHLVASTGGG